MRSRPQGRARASVRLRALVTGASRGIGRAIALDLASNGLDLVVTSTRKGGTRTVAALARGVGRRVSEVVYDAARPGDADRLARAAGKVDVLVLSAGTVVRKPLAKMRDEDFDQVVDVNLKGPFHLVRRLVPHMVKQGFGRVVFISSVSATLGTPGLSGYCASKWGLDGLMKSCAEEVREAGVFCCSVLPGSVATDMLLGSGFEPKMYPEDVARVVTWLVRSAPLAMHGARVELFG